LPAPAIRFRDEVGDQENRKGEKMIVVTGSVTARDETFNEVRQLSQLEKL
jgi:hypothetical protein